MKRLIAHNDRHGHITTMHKYHIEGMFGGEVWGIWHSLAK